MKNIVFDMGNVLTKYKLSDYIGTYTEDEAQAALLKNQVCASVEWICMDRGTMTDEEAVRSICKRIPQSEWELVERFVREFRMKQEPNPPMEALLGELKEQGCHLFLMSNTSHRFRAFSKNIPSVGYMDGIWISCECGYLKPEREAYVDFFQSRRKAILWTTRRQTLKRGYAWECGDAFIIRICRNCEEICGKQESI